MPAGAGSCRAIRRCQNRADIAMPGEDIVRVDPGAAPRARHRDSPQKQRTETRPCVVRRSALLLAAGTLAVVLTGCASNRLGGLANDLRNAEVGAPVDVTEQDGSVIVTSSADYMFPAGGWQIPSDSPVLNRMVPILSRLQNTKIVVTGYTD